MLSARFKPKTTTNIAILADNGKIYLSDVGILGAKAQMPVPMLLNAVETDNTVLGAVAENYAAFCIEVE